MFRTINSKFYTIAGILILLFSFGYTVVAFFLHEQDQNAIREQEAVFVDREIRSLHDLFFEIRFWERAVLARDHSEAEKKFGVGLEEMKERLMVLENKPVNADTREKLEKVSELLNEYEKDFNRIFQFKTEQRLYITRMDTSYRSLSSNVLRSNEPSLLKPFFVLTRFQKGYRIYRTKTEYQALKVAVEYFERKFSVANLMDERMRGYLKTFNDLLDKDFSVERQIRLFNARFDQISTRLMDLFSAISREAEKSLKNGFQKAEQNRNRLNIFFFISTALSIMILMAILIVMAMKIIRPIRSMANVMREVNTGNIQARFDSVGNNNDEIMQLGWSLNDMLDTVKENNQQLVSYQDELENKVSELALREGELEKHTADLTEANRELQHEIIERKRTQKERAELESRLQQSQKMESIGTLAGGIAHDFNNILGIVLGNAELAMDDVPEWNPARKNLDEVKKACMRAKDVVRQILSFSRKSEIEQKPISIASVVAESLKLSRASIPTSIEIRQNIANDVVDILGDSTQIYQIIINLCTNAAHAMENDGGILDVTLENTEIDEDTASLYPELNPGPHVHLRVSDAGDGIKPEVVDRIFDPYFTTKEVGKGTGMGLAVVHGIVKSHHGSISVESEPGKGTTFKILFPFVEKKSKGETKKFQASPTGTERILFVDDEESMVDLNQQRLQRLGYKVISKTDPLEALALFRANPDQIDLIISDMTMPHMTGDKLAQEILNIRPHMPIILCTGYSERMSEDRAQEIGIRKYIEKPIEKETLARSVREVLDGG